MRMKSDDLRDVNCDDQCQETRWKAADELDLLTEEIKQARWLIYGLCNAVAASSPVAADQWRQKAKRFLPKGGNGRE